MSEDKFIPGIYNYCDRWCERCAFTGKCRTFAMDQEEIGDGNPEDPAKFWDKMAQNLEDAVALLEEKAAEMGLDLDAITDDEVDEQLEQQRRSIEEHPISKKVSLYASSTEEWLRANKDLLKEWQEKLEDYYKIGLDEKQSLEEIRSVAEAVEIIRYYQYFIILKINRAISGKLQDENYGFEDNEQKDYDGSAKIALIAIDKSISSWHYLMDEFEQKQDEILDILALLDNIKTNTETYFPDARAFVRPGFDEV